ncbi:MAG: hypothetical protein F4X92_06260 [Gammaproteobacteria bacterium]|nr:hypothetical protein [Gammaproteobacteria bacterium]
MIETTLSNFRVDSEDSLPHFFVVEDEHLRSRRFGYCRAIPRNPRDSLRQDQVADFHSAHGPSFGVVLDSFTLR